MYRVISKIFNFKMGSCIRKLLCSAFNIDNNKLKYIMNINKHTQEIAFLAINLYLKSDFFHR